MHDGEGEDQHGEALQEHAEDDVGGQQDAEHGQPGQLQSHQQLRARSEGMWVNAQERVKM